MVYKHMKNIRKDAVLLVFLLLLPSVFALSKPLSINPTDLKISEKVGSGDIIGTECTPWEIKDEYCNGKVRHYDQCVKTVDGGVWQQMSEVCSDYGDNVRCLGGECVKYENILFSVAVSLLIIVVALILFFKLMRKKRK